MLKLLAVLVVVLAVLLLLLVLLLGELALLADGVVGGSAAVLLAVRGVLEILVLELWLPAPQPAIRTTATVLAAMWRSALMRSRSGLTLWGRGFVCAVPPAQARAGC